MAFDRDILKNSKSYYDYADMQKAFQLKKEMAARELASNEINSQREQETALQKMQYDAARDDLNFNRESALKMQLEGMRQAGRRSNAGGGTYIDPDTGEIRNDFSNKPLPIGALKLQQEAVDALSAANNTISLTDNINKKLDKNLLELGPVANLINKGRNMAGMSTPQSINYGLMTTDLEKLRNDTLRLNKGVQTEGDAIRAMNEVVQSKNDRYSILK